MQLVNAMLMRKENPIWHICNAQKALQYSKGHHWYMSLGISDIIHTRQAQIHFTLLLHLVIFFLQSLINLCRG